jgi:hypothetical protein
MGLTAKFKQHLHGMLQVLRLSKAPPIKPNLGIGSE